MSEAALWWAWVALCLLSSPRRVIGAEWSDNKVGVASSKVPSCASLATGGTSDPPYAAASPELVAAALRERPEGSRWCTKKPRELDPPEAKEQKRFDSCIAKKEDRYFCKGRDVLELQLPEGGGGVFTAMRDIIKEAFTRATIVPAGATATGPRQPRVFFWGDSHTRLLHQTLLCLWPKAPESIYPKNKGLFAPGHLIGKFTTTAKNPVNTRNGFWHGDVVVVNQGLWFNDKKKYSVEINRFANAVKSFKSSAPSGFRLTVIWVDSTVQHFGSSADGRYVKGSSKNMAERPGRLAACKPIPWTKLRLNAWRNVVTRKKFLPHSLNNKNDNGGGGGNASGSSDVEIKYFRLEDFAWDLSSYHPGVRRVKKSGNYVVDCAHYCVNYGGLPHFTLLAALHEAARSALGEEKTRGGVNVNVIVDAGGGVLDDEDEEAVVVDAEAVDEKQEGEKDREGGGGTEEEATEQSTEEAAEKDAKEEAAEEKEKVQDLEPETVADSQSEPETNDEREAESEMVNEKKEEEEEEEVVKAEAAEEKEDGEASAESEDSEDNAEPSKSEEEE